MTGSSRRYLVTGNWNSNGDTTFIKSFTMNVLSKLRTNNRDGDVIVAPPILYMQMLKEELESYEADTVKVCSQNVSKYTHTSLTGEVTAPQLKDLDINWVILGSSDRRKTFQEN